MIFKVQTDLTGQSVMIYNETRTITKICAGDEAEKIMSDLGMEAMQKVYVEGDYCLTNDDIVLGDKAPSPGW